MLDNTHKRRPRRVAIPRPDSTLRQGSIRCSMLRPSMGRIRVDSILVPGRDSKDSMWRDSTLLRGNRDIIHRPVHNQGNSIRSHISTIQQLRLQVRVVIRLVCKARHIPTQHSPERTPLLKVPHTRTLLRLARIPVQLKRALTQPLAKLLAILRLHKLDRTRRG